MHFRNLYSSSCLLFDLIDIDLAKPQLIIISLRIFGITVRHSNPRCHPCGGVKLAISNFSVCAKSAVTACIK